MPAACAPTKMQAGSLRYLWALFIRASFFCHSDRSEAQWKIRFARTNEPRGCKQIFRSKTKCALLQLLLGTLDKTLRRRKCVDHVLVRHGESVLWQIDLTGVTKTVTESQRDLPDMRNLFPGR